MHPGSRNNYQLIGANPNNNDNLQTRINQTISSKDGLDVNFNYQHRNSETHPALRVRRSHQWVRAELFPDVPAHVQPHADQQSGLEFQPQFERHALRVFVWPEHRGEPGDHRCFAYARAVRPAHDHVYELRVADRCDAFVDARSDLGRQRFADHDSRQANHHVRRRFPAAAEQYHEPMQTRAAPSTSRVSRPVTISPISCWVFRIRLPW